MRFSLSSKFAAIFLLAIFLARPQLSSVAEDKFLPGTYEGQQMRLVLRESSPGSFSGTLEFESRTYPTTARTSGSQLNGQFSAEGNSFPFTATFRGNSLTLSSGGSTYTLVKQAAPGGRFGSAPAAGQLHKHSLGYSLRLPANWTAADSPEGIVLLPSSATYDPSRNDNPELYIAMMKDGFTAADERQFVQQLSTTFTQSGAAVLRNGVRESATFGARQGMIYRWDVRDSKAGRNIAFDVFGAPESNRLFFFIAVGTADIVRQREPMVRTMLASMTMDAPRPAVSSAPAPTAAAPSGPLADSTPAAQQWLQKLRGRMIRQFYAYSGMSSDKYHYINADGTYVYRSNSMVSVDVTGASALSTNKGANTGRWKIRDVNGNIFLQVAYNNGETSMMRITQDSRNWYLNGEKAFAVDQQ